MALPCPQREVVETSPRWKVQRNQPTEGAAEGIEMRLREIKGKNFGGPCVWGGEGS